MGNSYAFAFTHPLPLIFRAPVPQCDYFGAEYENSMILCGSEYKQQLIMCSDQLCISTTRILLCLHTRKKVNGFFSRRLSPNFFSDTTSIGTDDFQIRHCRLVSWSVHLFHVRPRFLPPAALSVFTHIHTHTLLWQWVCCTLLNNAASICTDSPRQFHLNSVRAVTLFLYKMFPKC